MSSLTHYIVIVSLLATIAVGQEVEKDLLCPGGYCISKILCADPKAVNNNSLVTLRIGEEDVCEDHLMVCCKTDAIVENLAIPPPTDYSVCGQWNENGLFYQLQYDDENTTLARYAEYPWMVYVFTRPSDSFVSGGTLIHPLFVVTTAHNPDGKTNLIARFGEWDISSNNEHLPQQEIDVTEVINHPDYVMNPISNDIALLRLAQDVIYQQHIRPICLPKPTDQFDRERCISTGWGRDGQEYPNILKKITLPVVPTAACTRMLRYAGLGPYYRLKDGFMCAGGEENVDTCDGDGGSPLACTMDDGSFVLAGIVSWGIGCGGYQIPGVYVAVNRYRQWINQTIDEALIRSDFDALD